MLQLHKTQGKPANYYARLLAKNGNILWKTPATQYTTRRGAINAMFSGLDGFVYASNEKETKAVELRYTDYTGKEPVEKIAKRRMRS